MEIKGMGMPPSRYLEGGAVELSREAQKRLGWLDYYQAHGRNAALTCRYFGIRTCGLYGIVGSGGKGGNFVENMLKKAAAGVPIRVVNDQVLTPTFTGDLAELVSQLIQTQAYGLYHVTAEGQCSWYEFARTIFELERLAVDLTPARTDEIPSPVKRPSYSVLAKQKLRALGRGMLPWQDGLVRYLSARRARPTPTARSY